MLCGVTQGAVAQESDVESGQGIVLKPITVTADRYERDLQEVPASVEVITGEDLRKNNIRRLSDALRRIPGVSVYDDGGSFNTAISIRGIGNEIPFTDPAVTVFVNGIAYSGNLSDFDLQNVERIEVMRGPQSTLYGQNTLAGAINIVTKGPHLKTWSGTITGDLGTLGKRGASATAIGPIIEDKLGLTLEIAGDRTDGYLTNTTTGNDEVGAERKTRLRSVLDLAATDTIDAAFTFDYNKEEGAKTDAIQRHQYEFARATDPTEERTATQGALSLGWYGDAVEITSVTALNDISLDLRDVMVLVQGGETTNLVNTEEDTISQEFRVTSADEGGDLYWQLGTYLARTDYDLHQEYRIPGFATTQIFDYRQKSLRTEGYGQLDWEFVDGLTASVGGRLSRVKRDVNHTYLLNGAANFATGQYQGRTFVNTAGRAALTYALNDNNSVYASLGQSFKPGTARSGATNPNSLFLPSEVSKTIEVGAKGSIDRFTYGTTLFRTYYRDRHTFFNNGGVPVTEAVPDALSQGAEMSLDYAALDNWNIYGRAAYLNTRFGSYILSGSTNDIKGNQFRDAPKWTMAFGSDYTHNLGNGWELLLAGDVTFRTESHGNVSNLGFSVNSAYALVDASIGVSKGNFDVSLTGKNLLDRYYYTTTAINDGTGAPGAPRSVFLTVGYDF